MKKEVLQQLIPCLRNELKLSNAYLSLASYASVSGLENVSNCFYKRSDMKRNNVIEYLKHLAQDRGAYVLLPTVDQIDLSGINDINSYFTWTMKQEENNEEILNDTMTKVKDLKDYYEFDYLMEILKKHSKDEKYIRNVLNVFNSAVNKTDHELDKLLPLAP